MAGTSQNTGQDEKSLPSVVNHGYFSDFFLAYRLDAGLADLYRTWDTREHEGEATSRTRLRSLGKTFDRNRVDALLTAPDAPDAGDRLGLKLLSVPGVSAVKALNDDLLTALGWTPDRSEPTVLTSGEHEITVPSVLRCETPSGLLLLAVDAVFGTDPAAVVAGKAAPEGRLLDPVLVAGKPEGRAANEAAQLIFTADDPPSYLLICMGGGLVLLDRDRWGEGVYLGVNLDDAVARNDSRPRGELAAIAALFSAEAVNPGEDAESVLVGLLERAANESAGVSKELRHGVRRSVELLANAVVHDVRYRQKGAWTKLDPEQLTRECLRYLYRIIVLLFAEARPELGILPVEDPDYLTGYSLARLRDIALTELHGDLALEATHFQQSLELLFRVVNAGYAPDDTLAVDAMGLSFPGLGSTLFDEAACPMLDRARIGDKTLQQVLANLCFTREQKGRTRQSLSYSALGINQLGAVYEGLMAYKGFLATEELYEIDKDGDPDNGSWVIPVSLADEFSDDVFLTELRPDGHEHRVVYHEGDFVFRLSGRDRQRSASYYTPQVLTEFTVRHTLDVYWDEHPDLTAADIFKLTICEPALGSGAFLDEAVNQLAARYLKAAQDETGETIDPDRYQLELQKAKAHFTINQCYGVDLNPTAVELAEVSLWLNCMHPGLAAPNFDARLRRGNSLIGARRATYSLDQVKAQPWKDSAKKPAVPPTEQPLSEVPLGQGGGVHHFLVPGEGWGAAGDASDLKARGGKNPDPGLAGAWCEAVRGWTKSIQAAPTKAQLDRLVALSARVESAWETAASHLASRLRLHNRAVGVWKANEGDLVASGTASSGPFDDPEGPTARLRLLMDAWCALWMWSPANGTALPSFNVWLEAAELLLGQPTASESGALFTPYDLADGTLESVEHFGKASIEEVLGRFPWLRECQSIAAAQGFFHWELDQAGVFIGGGFDIQVGNPPWVRLDWDEPSSLAEFDPWWGVTDLMKTSDATKRQRRLLTLDLQGAATAVAGDRAENEGITSMLAARSREPFLAGIRTNLYMVFMTNTWRRSAISGVVGLLHPESHFVDPKAGPLRTQAYRRLRQHWQFANELFLFADVHHVTEFGVHVYARAQPPQFLQAVNLLAPATADRSLTHDGEGDLPAIQYPEGGWDLRPHAARIVPVDEDVLGNWVKLFDEPGTPASESRLLRPLTTADLGALNVFAAQPSRLADAMRFWTAGFNDTTQKNDGTFAWNTTVPESLDDCVLQGPHILNATPFAQQPRPECKNNTDWEAVELESLASDFLPRTNYQRSVTPVEFVRRQTDWEGRPYTERFRETHRLMIGSGAVRTVQAALMLPGPAHTVSMATIACSTNAATVRWTGLLTSIPFDYLIKVNGAMNLKKNLTDRLPIPSPNAVLDDALTFRVLRLNCLLRGYGQIWSELFASAWKDDEFVAARDGTVVLGDVTSTWSPTTPLRTEYDRWLALCEIDGIVALLLDLTEDQLIQMYKSQFAVLRKYEYAMVFDGNGRQIASDFHAHGFKQASWEAELKEAPIQRGAQRIGMWNRVQAYQGGDTTVDLGPFKPPFRPADRETAMRRSYRAFTERVESSA